MAVVFSNPFDTRTMAENTRRGIANLPGFSKSLRLLVEREQYSYTDIAAMFGVSYQRIQQICEREGLRGHQYPRGTYAVRVWDDARNRFRPVAACVVNAANEQRASRAKRLHRMEVSASRRTVKRIRIMAALDALRAELHREPGARELYERAFGVAPVHPTGCVALLSGTWSGQNRDMVRSVAQFRRECGYVGRPVGSPGHADYEIRQPSCA